MTETNTNPNALARQTREQAIRQAEDTFKNDLRAAAGARENAVHAAMAAKAEAVKQAQAALEFPRTRLSEARDRIEARLRKQEFDEVRRQQEKMLIKAEGDRVKALKQADVLGKRLAAEAAETRKRAIQQAYDNEKKMKLEAGQALKTQREAARAKAEEERKSKQRASQRSIEAKTRPQKATAAERSAREAISKTRETVKKEEPVPATATQKPEVAKPAVGSTANKEAPKTPSVQPKQGEKGPSPSRTGMIRLIIAQKDADSDHMVDFENSLRQIPDIHLVMVGGTAKEGAQIIVNADKAVALPDLLRQLPLVEEVNDRQGDILIKLKPVVIFESNT